MFRRIVEGVLVIALATLALSWVAPVWVGLVSGVLLAALWLAERRRLSTRPSRRQRREAERVLRHAEVARQEVDQANREREAMRRVERVEQSKRWRALPQIGKPAAPWGAESVNLWLHVPQKDTYGQHIGETVVCGLAECLRLPLGPRNRL